MVPYLEIVVAFTIAVHLLHTWLDLRQLRELQKRAPPPALASEFHGDKFLQVRTYKTAPGRLDRMCLTYKCGLAPMLM